MQQHTIDHPHNEASALIILHNQALLEENDWEVALWMVSDEAEAGRAVAALGRRRDGQWDVRPLKCKVKGNDEETDDAECMARAGSWIYILGSQFGSKDGPLDPERHFVARFNESLVRCRKRSLKGKMEVARPEFCLHRLVNDALAQRGIELIERGESANAQYIEATQREVDASDAECDLPKEADYPINVEGATFLPGGRLLLGLRYPVTADGHPILVEIDGIDRLFQKKRRQQPEVTHVLTLSNVGTRKRPRGIRELDQLGTMIHVITGDLDSDPARSAVAGDHRGATNAHSQHHFFEYPRDRRPAVSAERVREFEGESSVEGIVIDTDGSVWYAFDDEKIRLAHAAWQREPDRRHRRSRKT